MKSKEITTQKYDVLVNYIKNKIEDNSKHLAYAAEMLKTSNEREYWNKEIEISKKILDDLKTVEEYITDFENNYFNEHYA